MKKRRIFDIDLPDDEAPGFPAGKERDPKPGAGEGSRSDAARRSPMAAAITENAGALRERRVIEEKIRAENDALAEEHVRLKKLGLIVDTIPLDEIDATKLMRDRARGDDPELEELIASLRDIGLSNPIRVERRADGRYELIQGHRRWTAFKRLLEETGDSERWGRIPAGISAQGEELERLYRRMVDENLVRKDISFAEMAMVALHYAADPGTAETDPDKAVAELFHSAGYQKRSYIRQFIRLMSRLGDDLIHARHIPRALGLKLATVLDERPELVAQIRSSLENWDNRSVSDELEVLRNIAGEGVDNGEAPVSSRTASAQGPAGRAKTTFQLTSRLGVAKCMAANGRLEIKLPRDFSSLDRRKLQAAVARMLDELS